MVVRSVAAGCVIKTVVMEAPMVVVTTAAGSVTVTVCVIMTGFGGIVSCAREREGIRERVRVRRRLERVDRNILTRKRISSEGIL